MRDLLLALDARRLALLIALGAAGTVGGAWIFEAMGYAPCELCLMQRWAYYAGAPLALASAIAPPAPRRAGLIALALIFVASAAFGLYHSGVEWRLWAGPTACTGSASPVATSVSDFMKQLETVKVVRCDEPALRIFGLSLAGWNAILSSGLAAMAFAGSKRG